MMTLEEIVDLFNSRPLTEYVWLSKDDHRIIVDFTLYNPEENKEGIGYALLETGTHLIFHNKKELEDIFNSMIMIHTTPWTNIFRKPVTI